ncbi:MAG: ribosome maturation factor RimP [Acidobacteria bacterium]|nr:ribosome maturation factor RimP [Acidobacteriota bacterium]
MSISKKEAIGVIIERVTKREGLELVHWEMTGPRHNAVLRIFIDKDGGITHSDCETVSHQVSALLDVEDAIADSYLLEVSSPGVDRPLYKRADYERFKGNKVKLKTQQPVNGQRNFQGRLLGIEGDLVKLEVEQKGIVDIAFELITKANIEYEF